MTLKVKEMIKMLEEFGVRIEIDRLFLMKSEENQLKLLNKIFRETVA
jgi:hypothetical protein